MAKKATTSRKKEHPTKVKKQELPKDITNVSEEDKMELGIALFDQGSYIEAIEVFSRIAGEQHLLARQYLARCYYRMLQYESAYMHFSYLVERGDETMRDYGASMVAAIDMMWGNYGNAIKQLRLLPETPRNLIHLSCAYLKKYRAQKEEFSIVESMRLLKKINLDAVSPLNKHSVYHMKALIYQAQREYNLSKSCYQKAIDISVPLWILGSVLNDYASLHIEMVNFEEAYNTLLKVQEIGADQYEIAKAYNDKWLGILASIQNKHQEAGEYLQQAAKVIHEKDLLRELASIFYILADLMKNKNFYKAAEYFADAMNYEKLSEEVKDRDEKTIMFYYGNFFNISGNTSGIG